MRQEKANTLAHVSHKQSLACHGNEMRDCRLAQPGTQYLATRRIRAVNLRRDFALVTERAPEDG